MTGFLARAGDVDAFATALIRLLQDTTRARKMGERGRELIREQVSEELMVRRLDELYRRLANRH